MGAPRQGPGWVDAFHAGQGLGHAVAIGLANIEVGLLLGRELVRLIEDREVVRNDGWFLQASEDSCTRQRINADDDPIAAFSGEGVGASGIAAADDLERQTEELFHLAPPV